MQFFRVVLRVFDDHFGKISIRAILWKAEGVLIVVFFKIGRCPSDPLRPCSQVSKTVKAEHVFLEQSFATFGQVSEEVAF